MNPIGPSTVQFETSSPLGILSFTSVNFTGNSSFSFLGVIGSGNSTLGSNGNSLQFWTLQIIPKQGVCYLSGKYVLNFVSNGGNVSLTLQITSQNLCGNVY